MVFKGRLLKDADSTMVFKGRLLKSADSTMVFEARPLSSESELEISADAREAKVHEGASVWR